MKKRGFTLVELMIVVVIIGILAAVAIPRFANMVKKSKEGATKGQLTAIRSALQVYYSDNEGLYPDFSSTSTGTAITSGFASALVPKYISEIGAAKLPETSCTDNSSEVYALSVPTASVTSNGGWAYDGYSSNQTWGDIRVNCNDTTIGGDAWTSF